MARQRQLDTLEFEIYKHTTLMMKDLRTAAHSQLINPAFIKKLAAVKDNLEVVAAKINTYKEKNKEHDTPQLKRRAIFLVVAACRQFRYLGKLLDMEHAEL